MEKRFRQGGELSAMRSQVAATGRLSENRSNLTDRSTYEQTEIRGVLSSRKRTDDLSERVNTQKPFRLVTVVEFCRTFAKTWRILPGTDFLKSMRAKLPVEFRSVSMR